MITHNTVHQLLNVFRYFQKSHIKGLSVSHSYQIAVRAVAKQNDVTYQTIGDGCRRRLRLNDIGELYALLDKWANGDPNGLVEKMMKISPQSIHSEIKDFFYNSKFEVNNTSAEVTSKSVETKTVEFNFSLSEKDARLLKAVAEIDGTSITETITALIIRSLRVRIKDLVQEL